MQITLIGTFEVGNTITAVPSAPATGTWSWERDGDVINGANSDSYTLTAADAGKKIKAFLAHAGGTDSSPRAQVAQIDNETPRGSLDVTVSSVRTFTSDTSDITDDDGLGAFTFQWFRNAYPIPGATGMSYTETPADQGAELVVVAYYTDGNGVDEQVTSNGIVV